MQKPLKFKIFYTVYKGKTSCISCLLRSDPSEPMWNCINDEEFRILVSICVEAAHASVVVTLCAKIFNRSNATATSDLHRLGLAWFGCSASFLCFSACLCLLALVASFFFTRTYKYISAECVSAESWRV